MCFQRQSHILKSSKTKNSIKNRLLMLKWEFMSSVTNFVSNKKIFFFCFVLLVLNTKLKRKTNIVSVANTWNIRGEQERPVYMGFHPFINIWHSIYRTHEFKYTKCMGCKIENVEKEKTRRGEYVAAMSCFVYYFIPLMGWQTLA